MGNTEQKEMSFMAHLEELRWHLVRISIAILVVGVAIFCYQEWVYNNILLAHLNTNFTTYEWFCKNVDTSFCNLHFASKLQSLSPASQMMNAMWTSFILGVIVSFPYIIWELMRFIAPGLTAKERRNTYLFILIASFLLILGLLFSFYVICPMNVFFFYDYQITDLIENNFQFDSYISMINNTLLGVSLVFEMPLVIYFIAKFGLITPEFLRTYRKHAIVIILIVAAIVTPPDVASQIIVSIPMIILYEVSIIISKIVTRKNINS